MIRDLKWNQNKGKKRFKINQENEKSETKNDLNKKNNHGKWAKQTQSKEKTSTTHHEYQITNERKRKT